MEAGSVSEGEITSAEATTGTSAHKNRSGLLGWRSFFGEGRIEVNL